MKIATLFTITATVLMSTAVSRAAHVWEDPNAWWGSHFSYDQSMPKYTANELSMDLFGSYINPEGKLNDLFNTNIRHGSWGGGVGLSYFLSRNFGLGADFNMSDKANDANLVDFVVGNAYLRFPLGNSGLAPYLVGSGGRGMSPVYQWVYGGGVGLEYRFNPATGIFSDARFLWSDRATALNTLTIRAGLRLIF